MKPLPDQFTKRGFNHRLIVREGDVAVFERSFQGIELPHFEVVVVRRHDGFFLGGNHVEPAEYYPSDVEWGIYGWTYLSLADVKQRFESLTGMPFPDMRETRNSDFDPKTTI